MADYDIGNLAGKLSEITGAPVTPGALERFSVPVGSKETPIQVGSNWLTGYSQYRPNISGGLFYVTFNLGEGDITVERAFTCAADTKARQQIVAEALTALINLWENEKSPEKAGIKDTNIRVTYS